MKRYALDLDNTVFDWATPFLDFMRSKGFEVEERHKNGYNLAYNISGEEDYQKYYDEFHQMSQYKDLALLPGAVEGINLLNKYGKVYAMTRREQKYRKVTELELLKHGIQYEDIFIDLTLPKKDICKYLGINIIVDDCQSTILKTAEEGIKSYCMHQPWNESILYEIPTRDDYRENIVVVSSWQEIVDNEIKF